jgi:hypothetical protein
VVSDFANGPLSLWDRTTMLTPSSVSIDVASNGVFVRPFFEEGALFT